MDPKEAAAAPMPAAQGPQPSHEQENTPLKIGNVEISSPLALAPMAGVTDLAFRQVCRNLGAGYTVTEMVSAKALCYQDKKTLPLLKLAPEEPVTKLVRIRHLENMYANAPVVYTTLYVPVKLFPDMARTDFTETSFYEALDSRGLSVAHASRRLEVVMPPEEVAAGLEITAFEPVAFIVSRGYTGSGQAVEYTESYYPASRSSFRIEIDR